MLVAEETVETKASPESIWKIWQDVSQWNTWDHVVESSHLNGPFETRTLGTLKPRGGPSVKTELTSVQPFTSFVMESKLPLAKIVVSHYIKAHLVTHKIEIVGPLAFFFNWVMGKNMKDELPQVMKNLAKKAELLEGNANT